MNDFFGVQNKGYKIKTPQGWEHFEGIECTGYDPIWKITFSNSSTINCNKKHRLLKVLQEDRILDTEVQFLKEGDTVLGTTDNLKIQKIELTNTEEAVYEIIHVQDSHTYNSNDVVSHNCEFVTYQETLIDAMKLREIRLNQVRTHIAATGNIRWFKQPQQGMTYLVALDPASGTGGADPTKSNYSAIQVYEVPSLDQVAEWYDNTVDIGGQVRMLNKILRIIDSDLYEQGDDDPEIYWTVENNSIGEATIIDIMNMGLENFPGTMLNEPKRSRTGKLRRGYNTSKGTKKTACFTLKKLVEQEKLEIASEALYHELNGFIAKDLDSTLYSAKAGSTDDLVSALLLIVRMVGVVSTYEDELADSIKESLEEDLCKPLPIIMSSNYR